MDGEKVDGGAPAAPVAPDFERVEYASGAAPGACHSCQSPLGDADYQVNAQAICGACRQRIGAEDTSLSARERLTMATVFGAGAAILGSLVWYLVARVTGMELGIIAI